MSESMNIEAALGMASPWSEKDNDGFRTYNYLSEQRLRTILLAVYQYAEEEMRETMGLCRECGNHIHDAPADSEVRDGE